MTMFDVANKEESDDDEDIVGEVSSDSSLWLMRYQA